MQLHGWEANVGGENLIHILVRENPSKAALLEEFLHGTQAKTGVIERFSLKHGGMPLRLLLRQKFILSNL